MSVTIQIRRDTAANWTSANPVLHDGELGYEKDTGKAKIGDGSTAWNSMAYWSPVAAPVTSVNGRTGAVTLAAADVGADASGAASAAQAASLQKTANLSDLASRQTALNTLAGSQAIGQFLRGNGTNVLMSALQPIDIPDMPWQFRPETYGAVGDGKVFADGVTNGTTTFTSATANFTSADNGKHIMINGGNGNPGGPVITTITFVNSTTVTLGVAAGASATGCAFVYGTDDTAAINSAISAASTYAQANNFMAEVLLKSSVYVVTSLTQETSPATYNTQLVVPFPNANGTTRKLMLTFRGAGYMAPCQYWESVFPNVQGSAIVSMQTAPFNIDATFGRQSVIGGPTGGTLTGGFANTHLTLLNMSVWCPGYTNMRSVDMTLVSGCHLDGFSAQVFMPANNLSGATAAHPYMSDLPSQALFTNSSAGVGIVFPNTANNDAASFGEIVVEGYEVGIWGQDHLIGQRYAGLYCDVILKITPATSHEVSIQSVSAEVYNGGILVSGGSYVRLDIGWDGEVTSPVYDINASSATHGVVRWTDTFHAAPIVAAAGNLKIVNDNLGPGAWSGQPSVPGTTVAQQNTSWRDAAVSIKGGTVSIVAVDGVTVATVTNTTVIVPAGKNITLTYSSAPTWAWTLL